MLLGLCAYLILKLNIFLLGFITVPKVCRWWRKSNVYWFYYTGSLLESEGMGNMGTTTTTDYVHVEERGNPRLGFLGCSPSSSVALFTSVVPSPLIAPFVVSILAVPQCHWSPPAVVSGPPLSMIRQW